MGMSSRTRKACIPFDPAQTRAPGAARETIAAPPLDLPIMGTPRVRQGSIKEMSMEPKLESLPERERAIASEYIAPPGADPEARHPFDHTGRATRPDGRL